MSKMKFNSAAGVTLALAGALAAAAPASAEVNPPPGCTGKTKTGVWLNVVAEGVKSSEGLIAITVYEDVRSRFLAKGGSIWVGRVKAEKGSTRGCVFLPKTGVYAIALYHDENSDHNFNRSLLPEEGYGFSNNASTLAGLPAWRSVRLNVPKTNLTTHITMKYP